MVFHFGQNEIGVWSIYCNCLHDTTRNEAHCGCYFIAIILTEMGCKMSCKHFPKWNHKKGNICTCVYFIKRRMIDSNWMGCICWTTPETKFYFIYPKVKSNVNNFFLWLVEISIRVAYKHPLNNYVWIIIKIIWFQNCAFILRLNAYFFVNLAFLKTEMGKHSCGFKEPQATIDKISCLPWAIVAGRLTENKITIYYYYIETR